MKSVQIDKALNIHARPAALLARLASGYKSMIFFSAGDKFADAFAMFEEEEPEPEPTESSEPEESSEGE